AGAATDLVATEGDPVLEEPESLLGVTAVVETVRPEVDELARRVRSCGTVRARGFRVPDGEAVLEVVFVRQPAGKVLPGPLVDVDRVLGPAAGEEAAVRAGLGGPGHRRGAAGDRCGPAASHAAAGDLVTNFVPVVERGGCAGRVRARLGIAVELEDAGVVYRLRGVWDQQRENHCRDEGQHQRTAYAPNSGRPSAPRHSEASLVFSRGFPVLGATTSSSAEPTPLWARSRCHARPTSCVPAWE